MWNQGFAEEAGGAREDASLPAEAGAPDASDVRAPARCTDGERAILTSYVSLMRQCVEFAEKARVTAAKLVLK
ncbi:hypothetical protein MSG28_010206 [Choristoneura fumiferana]|uniref:Uncharacterized protein n=1 Tax=Choristoneura fumiferana TaxID=7141 RepID=A0ACC0KJV7_CHOFU|nr:hypothetical protein MSG28_010206 [Choristoneura fumiferana]